MLNNATRYIFDLSVNLAGNVSRFIGLQHGQIVKKLEIPGATAFEISAPLPVPLKQPKIPKFSPWGRAPIIKTKPYERRSQGVQVCYICPYQQPFHVRFFKIKFGYQFRVYQI